MYPSIVLLPAPMIGFWLLKKYKGPCKTLNVSADIANRLLQLTKNYISSKTFTPEMLHTELAILHVLTPHRWLSCFETACAFQLWLAFHGEASQVVLGKRIENHQLCMHAWVETENAVFFKESEFDIVEWQFSE